MAALRELVEGDCGGRNPMLKVASHFTQNQGLQHDINIPHRSIDTKPEDVMAREFLAGIPPPPRVGPNAFNMHTLLEELRGEGPVPQHRFPIQPGPSVATHAFDAKNWAEDFLREDPHIIRSDAPPSASGWDREFMGHPGYMGAAAAAADWDTDWDNITSHIGNPPAQQEKDILAQTAGEIVDSLSDPKFAESEFLQFMKNISSGQETLEPEASSAKTTNAFGNSNWAEEFTAGAEGAQASVDLDWTKEFTSTVKPDLAEEWSQEFTGGASAEVYRGEAPSQDDFWSQLQRDWDKAAEDNPYSLGFLKDPIAGSSNEYAFESENPYKEISDPFNAGLQKKAEGDLPSAILLFEAALQKDPDHMKAWEVLGLSLAENEQDPGAILAYKRCLALEPTNLVALMGLSVSYTNESYQLQACQALENWLRGNPKYAHLASAIPQEPVNDRMYSSLMSGDTFNRVQDMYMKAARLQPSGNLDPDVQTGLGVLLNLSGEFEKAPDCFRAALQMKPNDSLLWNRLGATLANGGRSEEAVEAYYKALEISPGFIRARYNLAVSCINLGAHKEAAEHLVSALQLQARRSNKRVMSDNIWSTLRMVLSLMNRREFVADIDAKDLTRLAAEFGTVAQ